VSGDVVRGKARYSPRMLKTDDSAERAPAEALAPLGPRQLKVLMDISNKCNLRCRMCHFSFDRVFYRPSEYLTPADFTRIADQVFPYAHTVVLSAGSEPTTSPHFEEILAIAGKWGLQELKFLTNATLLTPSMISAIIDCGVSQIDVSVDGALASTYEAIRRGARFERLVRNLKRLRDMKQARGVSTPLVQFNLTLMKSNLAELDRFVDLAEECGVERIGARHLMPYAGLNMQGETLFDIPREANRAFKSFIERVERSRSVRLITFPDYFKEPADKEPATTTADGFAEIATRLSRGDVGTSTSDREVFPFGCVDLPAPAAENVAETLHMAGWALDRHAVDHVAIVSRDASAWHVHALAKRVNGSRPDVAEHYPAHPGNSSAGWLCDLDIKQVSAGSTRAVQLEVIAMNSRGKAAVIGTCHVRSPSAAPAHTPVEASPFLFCQKPFNSIYVESNGTVHPYPDCRPERPSGNLLRGDSFLDIWYGAEQHQLRLAIIAQRPPTMCRTCPNFINRRPDDVAFFVERRVEENYQPVLLRGRLATRKHHPAD
jgi:MoaA/NifB/PqqE/SkfB family radical SAM enzyme